MMTRTFVRQPVSKRVKLGRKEITYLVPVMVVIDSIPNDRVLYRYLFPERAEIVSFMMNFKNLKSKLKVIADLKVEGGGEYVEFEVDEGINGLLEAKTVLKGTTVELSIPEYDETIHGKPQIWISYLYKIVR